MSIRRTSLLDSFATLNDLKTPRSIFSKPGPQNRVGGALPKPYVDKAGRGKLARLIGYHSLGSVVAGYPAEAGAVPVGRNRGPFIAQRNGMAPAIPSCPFG